jgi:hypothetical protein
MVACPQTRWEQSRRRDRAGGPKIVRRKDSIVHREVVEKLPTGWEE